MPTTTPLDPRPAVKSRSAFPALLLGILLGLLVALVAVPAAVRHVGASMRSRVSLAFLGRHDAVERNPNNQYPPDLLTGNKLLLIVHGQAVAGVDLSSIQASNVQIDGRSITIAMPAAQLLSVSLDNSKTRVYSRITGLLVPADPHLESEV